MNLDAQDEMSYLSSISTRNSFGHNNTGRKSWIVGSHIRGS